MKYNLRKKHSLFELLSTQIKIFVGICVALIIIFIGYLFRDYLKDILKYLATIFTNYETYVFIGRFILIPISLIGILYYVIDFSISICRNRYIPLEKDELEENNIYTFNDYNEFLMRFLRGYHPLWKVSVDIIETAQAYLKKDEKPKEMSFSEEIRWPWNKKNRMYWEYSYSKRTHKIIFITGLICTFVVGIILATEIFLTKIIGIFVSILFVVSIIYGLMFIAINWDELWY